MQATRDNMTSSYGLPAASAWGPPTSTSAQNPAQTAVAGTVGDYEHWGEPGGGSSSASGSGWGAADNGGWGDPSSSGWGDDTGGGWASSLGSSSTSPANAPAFSAWSADGSKAVKRADTAGGWGSSSAGASSVPRIDTGSDRRASNGDKLVDAASGMTGTSVAEHAQKEARYTGTSAQSSAPLAAPPPMVDPSGLHPSVSSSSRPPHMSDENLVNNTKHVSKPMGNGEQCIPQTVADLHRHASLFVKDITLASGRHSTLQEAMQRDVRVKRMQTGRAYTRSTIATQNTLEASRADSKSAQDRSQHDFTKHIGTLPMLPDIGKYVAGMDPSASSALLNSFLAAVKVWFERLDPHVKTYIAERKASKEARLASLTKLEPEDVPDALEKYASSVKELERKLDVIAEGFSQRPEGVLTDELHAHFHDREPVINGAICKAYQNAMDLAFQRRLEDAAEVQTELSRAIEDRRAEVVTRLAVSREPIQRRDFKSEMKQWRDEFAALRRRNESDLKEIKREHAASTPRFMQARPAPQPNIDQIAATIAPHLGQVVKANFEPVLNKEYRSTLDSITQQQKDNFTSTWKAIEPGIVLTHYMALKADDP